jgi:hypothetical protein
MSIGSDNEIVDVLDDPSDGVMDLLDVRVLEADASMRAWVSFRSESLMAVGQGVGLQFSADISSDSAVDTVP